MLTSTDSAIGGLTSALGREVGALRAALRPAAVDLYWLPLGAGVPSGSRLVRVNGRVYEALSAAFERRRPLDLYHAGLEFGSARAAS